MCGSTQFFVVRIVHFFTEKVFVAAAPGEDPLPPINFSSPAIPALNAALHVDMVDNWNSIDAQKAKDWRLVNHGKIQSGEFFWGHDVRRNSDGRGTGSALTNLSTGENR